MSEAVWLAIEVRAANEKSPAAALAAETLGCFDNHAGASKLAWDLLRAGFKFVFICYRCVYDGRIAVMTHAMEPTEIGGSVTYGLSHQYNWLKGGD